MDLSTFIEQINRNAHTIRHLAEALSPNQARWKPDPETWSILEVVNHLFDEEREDFRVRLEIILNQPDRSWPEIDPQGWVKAREYNKKDLPDSLGKFLLEREKSIEWLHGLSPPDWNKSCEAPWGGRISAGDMFAAWVAHDLLHTRQLVEIHWAWSIHQLKPFEVNYAGTW